MYSRGLVCLKLPRFSNKSDHCKNVSDQFFQSLSVRHSLCVQIFRITEGLLWVTSGAKYTVYMDAAKLLFTYNSAKSKISWPITLLNESVGKNKKNCYCNEPFKVSCGHLCLGYTECQRCMTAFYTSLCEIFFAEGSFVWSLCSSRYLCSIWSSVLQHSGENFIFVRVKIPYSYRDAVVTGVSTVCELSTSGGHIFLVQRQGLSVLALIVRLNVNTFTTWVVLVHQQRNWSMFSLPLLCLFLFPFF